MARSTYVYVVTSGHGTRVEVCFTVKYELTHYLDGLHLEAVEHLVVDRLRDGVPAAEYSERLKDGEA